MRGIERNRAIFYSTLLIILLAGEVHAVSQRSEPVKNELFANCLNRLGLVEDAAFEYLRNIDSLSPDDMYSLGECYLKLGNLNKAVRIWQLLSYETSDSTLLLRSLDGCAFIELTRGNLDKAAGYITSEVERGIIDPGSDDRRYIVIAANGDWSALDIDSPRKRSALFAEILSLAIPGAGQIYAGETLEGLRSTAVNGGIWYIIIAGLSNGYYARALVVFNLMGARYWIGGADKARVLVEKYNADERLRTGRELAKMLR